MLHVTRLTDKSGRALRVESLERFLKGDPGLLKQVKKHRQDAVMAAVPVADWRNRAIAHRDRSLVTAQSPKPLAAVKLETCKEVLDHVRAGSQRHSATSHEQQYRKHGCLRSAWRRPCRLPQGAYR